MCWWMGSQLVWADGWTWWVLDMHITAFFFLFLFLNQDGKFHLNQVCKTITHSLKAPDLFLYLDYFTLLTCITISQFIKQCNAMQSKSSSLYVSTASSQLLGYPVFSPLGGYIIGGKTQTLPAPLTVLKMDNARRKVFKELRKAKRVILEMCILPGNKLCPLDGVKIYGQGIRQPAQVWTVSSVC